MKHLDLGPNEYRRHDGPRLVNPKLCRNAFVVALAILAYVFSTRAEGSRETLFGITAGIAFIAGGLFALWRKDVH